MKHININASQTEQVTSEMLDTLALLCGMSLDETSDLVGSLISEFGFHDTKAKLMARFPHLALQIDTLWVRFADDEVRKVLGKKVKGDENANFTVKELAEVKSLNDWFVSNTKIETFEELSLTGITTWGRTVRFDGCENLKAIDVSKLTGSDAGGYTGKTKIKVFNFTSMRNLVSSIFNPIAGGDYVRAVFLPVVETISPYPGTHDNGWSITFISDTKAVLIVDLGAKAKFVRESVDWFNNCPNAYGIYRGVGNNIAKGANEKIFTPIKDEANGFFAIGGSKWQEVMRQLAEEEGKAFDDYSLRYIDYDIYGVDYATDELNALTLSIPDEYLGRDGETFVFDSAPLAIGFDPEPTRKEYFTLSKSGSDSVSVADTETRFIKMITMNAANAGSLHDVTFTAVSSQVEGVKAVRAFKCAYPLISAVNLSFSNQFVSAALESNTDNAKYTQLEFSSEGGVGVSDNGWVYANAHGEAASGTVTVRSKTTSSSVSSIEVAVSADAVQRQFFADAEVERVILSKKVDNKGNVISEDVFRELKDISEWFRYNKVITSFNELCNIKSVKITKAFQACFALESVCFDGMTIVGDSGYAFLDCKALKSVDLSKAKITPPNNSMYSMFSGCSALERVNFRGMDAAHILSIANMFARCVGLKYVDFGDLDTSNMNNNSAMNGIFSQCRKIESLKLGAPFFNAYKKFECSDSVFKDLDSWVNDDEIADVLSCLPDLTSLNLSRTLYFSANTFAHITQTQIEEALAKGWTITK